MKPIYLPVNRNSKDFQLIHLDMLKAYGIAFKFNFSNTDDSFLIKDGKLILATIFGPKEYKISIDKKFRAVNDSKYGFMIDILTTNNKFEQGKFPSSDTERGDNFRIAEMDIDGAVKPEFLIDLHISNKEILSGFKEFTGKAVDWGTEFCRFYIV